MQNHHNFCLIFSPSPARTLRRQEVIDLGAFLRPIDGEKVSRKSLFPQRTYNTQYLTATLQE